MLINVKTVITSILSNNKSVDNPNDIANILITFLLMLVRLRRRESPGEVIAPYSTLGIAIPDQFFYPLSLHMKFGLLLLRWMLASLLAHTVYLLQF